MKYTFKNIGFIAAILFASYSTAYSQTNSDYNIAFQVKRVFKPLSISKKEFQSAKTLKDLNPYFKPQWVKEYDYVEISTSSNGRIYKSVGSDDILTEEQITRISKADVASDIVVSVHYLPENTLKLHEKHDFNFTFSIYPEKEAMYPDGELAMQQYFEESVMNSPDLRDIKQYNVLAVNFSVNPNGQIIDVRLHESSDNKILDELLLKTICNMPSWIPAEYSNGLKIKQDFVFVVGDMSSCTMNILNIRNLPPE